MLDRLNVVAVVGGMLSAVVAGGCQRMLPAERCD